MGRECAYDPRLPIRPVGQCHLSEKRADFSSRTPRPRPPKALISLHFGIGRTLSASDTRLKGPAQGGDATSSQWGILMYGQAGHAIRKWLHSAAIQLGQSGIEEGIKKAYETVLEANEKGKQAGKGNLAVRGGRAVRDGLMWLHENSPRSQIRK
jgi:hypothetical protein